MPEPDSTDDHEGPDDLERGAPRDEVLDGLEADFDNVASALEALDADDLDGAESLVGGLRDIQAPRDADQA